MDNEAIKQEVRKHYGEIARSGSSCCGGDSCCDSGTSLVDYGVLDQQIIPGANLGLGCGLPTTFAEIQPGETVLDLGSGAGVDVFLAARSVGPTGHAIGVDMTAEMIARARQNAARGGYANVDFRLGEIESLPVESGSVDVVLSNCVINLVPDKSKAYAEIFRVLKPGGRFSVSDTVTYGEVPEWFRNDISQWAGCISGALDKEVYLQIIRDAGFTDVQVKQLVENGDEQANFGLASITVGARKP